MRYKIFTLLLFCSFVAQCFSTEIPQSVKTEYALKMHEGFSLQSVGQSTLAYYTFKKGYQAALEAGESVKKLQVIHDLFLWYRRYGHYLGLFLEEPSGKDRITDEYGAGGLQFNAQSPLAIFRESRTYEKNAETAEIARNCIFGTGEVIAGILGCAYLPGASKVIGLELAILGADRIWDSFNRLKTKNDAIAQETRRIIDQIKETARSSQSAGGNYRRSGKPDHDRKE